MRKRMLRSVLAAASVVTMACGVAIAAGDVGWDTSPAVVHAASVQLSGTGDVGWDSAPADSDA